MKNIKSVVFTTILAILLPVFAGCSKIYVVQWVGNGTEDQGTSGTTDDQTDGTGLGNNLVNFHASVESLNMTKSMSPISVNTRVTIYAFHGSTDNATSTSAVARGTYISQQAGTLAGDSGNYDVTGAQVTVPIILNHSATQVTFEIDHGEGMYVQDIASATITVPVPGAQMDLSTGVIPPATEYDSTPASMGINGLKLQYTMLPLKTDTPMKLTIGIHANGEPDVKTYEVDVPVPDGALEAGNSYRFRAVINADDVTFAQVGVTDWVDVDETGNPLYPH